MCESGGVVLDCRRAIVCLGDAMLLSSKALDKFLEARFRGRRCVPRSARDAAVVGQSEHERIWTWTFNHRTHSTLLGLRYKRKATGTPVTSSHFISS
jgi:hypothetical protein